MFTRLLVPLDGSPLAETALPAAKMLVRRFGAELDLMRALHPIAAAEESPSDSGSISPSVAQAYLDRLAAQLTEEGITTHTMLPPADPAEGIIVEAELDQVDLIVMATHGRTGLDALLHPSVTWQVLQATTAPILTWKCGKQEVSPPVLPRFMTDPTAPLLIPLDGSPEAESVLPIAQELAHRFGNALVLVRAVEPASYLGRGVSPETGALVDKWRVAEAQSYLHHQRLELVRVGFQVTTAAEQGPAAPLIEEWVRNTQAGLVVMASHGRGWLGRVVLGSVTRRVLSQVQVPLLLLRRPHAERDDTRAGSD